MPGSLYHLVIRPFGAISLNCAERLLLFFHLTLNCEGPADLPD
jgi:hypothetical protein